MSYNDQKAVAKAQAMASEIRREMEERGLEQIVTHHVSPRHIHIVGYDPKKKRTITQNGIVREDGE